MIADNLHAVAQRIAHACQQCDRPVDAVRLLAVSKTFGDQLGARAYSSMNAVWDTYIKNTVRRWTQKPLGN